VCAESKEVQHLEVFEGLPQGVRAGVFLQDSELEKAQKDRAFKVVEGSTGSLCIGTVRRRCKFVSQAVEYRGKTTW
jgi:hypothetical protein